MPLRLAPEPEDDEDIVALVEEQIEARAVIAKHEKTDKRIKATLKEVLDKRGEVDPDSGSRIISLGIPGASRIEHRRSVTKGFDSEKALSMAREKGVEDRCVDLVPVVNQDKLMALHYEDPPVFTEDEINSLLTENVVWSYWIIK